MKFIDQSYFFLPQLTLMVSYKSYKSSIEHYLLDSCLQKLKFTMKINWIFSAFINSSYSKNKDRLIQKIEMNMINGKRANLSNLSEEKLMLEYKLKEIRLNYFDKVMRFYSNLQIMCDNLKNVEKTERNESLRDYIKNFNRNIETMKKGLYKEKSNNLVSHFYFGYILPFDDSDHTDDLNNTLIVNILGSHSFCFTTKARVPVKLVVETIKANEVKDFFIKFLEKDKISSSNIKDNNSIIIEHHTDIRSTYKYNKYSSINDFIDKINEENQDDDVDLDKFSGKLININCKSAKINTVSKIVDTKLSTATNSYKISVPTNNDNLKSFGTLSSSISNFKSNDNASVLYNNIFEENWDDKMSKIKLESCYQKFDSYQIKCFIVKSNDDLRQELMTMQIVKKIQKIFNENNLPLKLTPYEVLVTSSSSGLIEYVPNTVSIDSLKKQLPSKWTLNTFYRNYYKNKFYEAQRNFVESLAAYCIICYLMNIKDRYM